MPKWVITMAAAICIMAVGIIKQKKGDKRLILQKRPLFYIIFM